MKRLDLENELADFIHESIVGQENEGLDLNQLAEGLVAIAEKYMVPKPVRKTLDTPDGNIPAFLNEWE